MDDVLCQQTASCQWFPRSTRKLTAVGPFQMRLRVGSMLVASPGQIMASKMCVSWLMERGQPVPLALNPPARPQFSAWAAPSATRPDKCTVCAFPAGAPSSPCPIPVTWDGWLE